MYKQPIILFGIVVPLLICAVILGACAFVRGKVNTSFENKVAHYSGYETSRLGTLSMEAKISGQRADFERWNAQLNEETFSTVTSNLRTIAEGLPPKEFQQTAFERLTNQTDSVRSPPRTHRVSNSTFVAHIAPSREPSWNLKPACQTFSCKT